jgi:hypothetical protein
MYLEFTHIPAQILIKGGTSEESEREQRALGVGVAS